MAAPIIDLHQLLADCDNFPLPNTPEHETLFKDIWSFVYHDGSLLYTLGYLTPPVLHALQSLPTDISTHITINPSQRSISLTANTPGTRTASLALITTYWRTSKTFPILEKWRNEETAIFAPQSTLYATVERTATPLFGFVAYYVYLIAYNGSGSSTKIWIQRRAPNKASYGGLLDTTVAGAIQAGQAPRESIVREALEEASLAPEVVSRATQILTSVPAGDGDEREETTDRLLNLNIVASSGADGEKVYYRPGCGFGFELELRGGEVPAPSDGEVSEFYEVGVRELKERLGRGEFMPHAAKTLIEWLVGRGLVELEKRGYRRRSALEFPLM
ncbi:hypothetical protein B0O99DRAFT_737448 [Bisporella sp. PMI_857]|nr:hypothetical protein B0O99DRAFT_737448 [Bisporella sp. PMI_857]